MTAPDRDTNASPTRRSPEDSSMETPPRRPFLSDTCRNYIMIHAAFEDQRQPGSHARQHIDECPACQQYFVRAEWERKKEEELLNSPEVEALVADYAKRFRVPFYQRRKFLAAASVLALGALGLGAKAWFGRSGPRPIGTGGSPTPNVDRAFQEILDDLDRVYQEGGDQAIGKIFSRGTEQEVVFAEHWLALRGHTSLIGVLIAALSDSRLKVRTGAVAALMRMPPLAVQPFQSGLNQAANSETDPHLSTVLQDFALEISRAR